jgi:hypothetical protein
MKKLLTLAAAALVFAAPAFADDEDRGDAKQAQHWNPGGVYAVPTNGDHHRGRGWDRDRDGDHDRRDHRQDWGRNDNRWNNNSSWNNGYRYGGERNILGRWALVNFDFNRDGRLDPREYHLSQRAFYDLADRNNDGFISEKDWRKFTDKYAYRNDVGYRYAYQQRGNPRSDYHDSWRR